MNDAYILYFSYRADPAVFALLGLTHYKILEYREGNGVAKNTIGILFQMPCPLMEVAPKASHRENM